MELYLAGVMYTADFCLLKWFYGFCTKECAHQKNLRKSSDTFLHNGKEHKTSVSQQIHLHNHSADNRHILQTICLNMRLDR